MYSRPVEWAEDVNALRQSQGRKLIFLGRTGQFCFFIAFWPLFCLFNHFFIKIAFFHACYAFFVEIYFVFITGLGFFNFS
jgi:hypothetical protein